jgi:hypothetical protein
MQATFSLHTEIIFTNQKSEHQNMNEVTKYAVAGKSTKFVYEYNRA